MAGLPKMKVTENIDVTEKGRHNCICTCVTPYTSIVEKQKHKGQRGVREKREEVKTKTDKMSR